MKYEIIASGSKGNAVLIDDSILIDCGVSYRRLKPYVKQLKLVLLTHIHGDHFRESTVRALNRARPALRFGCCEWMVIPLVNAGVNYKAIDVFDPEHWFLYGSAGIGVLPEKLTHDAPNCGYHIILTAPGGQRERLFYATDTGTLEGVRAKDYDLYLIEANHSMKDLEARAEEKMDAGEYAYEIRAAANHLSLEQATMGPNSSYEFLHQHTGQEVMRDGRMAEAEEHDPDIKDG